MDNFKIRWPRSPAARARSAVLADRRLVLARNGGDGCWAGYADRPAVSRTSAAGDSKAIRSARGFMPVHVDRLGRRCSSTASSWASAPGRPSCRKLGWVGDQIDKVICHQVGAGHRETILKRWASTPTKEF